jgi:carboxylesterase
MEPLRGPLEDAGLRVENTLLPGHDRSVEAFCATGFEDWAGHVEQAFLELKKEHAHVFVVGLSMGGSLALRLAQRHPAAPAGIVTIASPVHVYRYLPLEMQDWRLPLVPLLRKVRPIWPAPPPSEESRTIAPWRGYEGVHCLVPLHSFLQGLKAVRRDLPKVRAPLLSLHAPTDRTSPVSNLWTIGTGVSSPVRRLALLRIEETVTGHHLLTTHRETRDTVASMVREFILDVLDGDGTH